MCDRQHDLYDILPTYRPYTNKMSIKVPAGKAKELA